VPVEIADCADIRSCTARLGQADACQVYLDGEFFDRDPGHIRRNLSEQTKRDFADRIGLTQVLVPR
jgi:hypothetical protein